MDKITSFTINKLHGYKDVALQFVDNTLILVGENGAGKTTVLNLFYYLLSGQWSAMIKYSFEEVAITIGAKQFKLRYSELEKSFRDFDSGLIRRLPPVIRQRVYSLIEQNEGRLVTPELEMLCNEYGIPLQYLLHEMDASYHRPGKKNTSGLKQQLEAITGSLNAQVLFLPTYRRIEQELNLIFKGMDEREHKQRRDLLTSRRDSRTYVELIEFGMKDVENAINGTLSKLSIFARESLNDLTFGYLGDIVEKQYTKVDLKSIRDASAQTIANVLNRIQEHILSSKDKQHLHQIIEGVKGNAVQNEHTMVICHYFTKLMSFQKDLERKEAQITSFCRVCNEYMVDKMFKYDFSNFSFTINPTGDKQSTREIKLSHLSSGEKQIVSLFSHLYLSGGDQYFVLIDEPELSLSVPWQRRFLADIRSANFALGSLRLPIHPLYMTTS